MIMQERNPEAVDILRADFQHRNEPNFAWKSAASVLQGMPGGVGAWPMSLARLDNSTDRARDIGGGGYHLTQVNTIYFGSDGLAPYVEFNGTDSYLVRTAGAASWASVLGTEGYIEPTQRGLLAGGWFWFDGLTGNDQYCLSKGDANQNSYGLYRTNGRICSFWVSNNGVALVSATTGAVTVADLEWHCIIGRFDPSTAVELFVDGTWYTNAVGVPASIFDGTADFHVGSYGTPSRYLDGKASDIILSASDMADALVFSYYQQTRRMFGR